LPNNSRWTYYQCHNLQAKQKAVVFNIPIDEAEAIRQVKGRSKYFTTCIRPASDSDMDRIGAGFTHQVKL